MPSDGALRQAEWKRKNPKLYAAQLERDKEARRQKYKSDPDFRAKCIALSAERYAKKKDQINAKRKTDSFRAERKTKRRNSEKEQETMRRYNRTPERRRVMQRVLFLKKYGLTIEQYDEMLKAQNGVCAICGGNHTPDDRWKSGLKNLRVDHCHKTNTVRGLLCFHCNTALGHFRDDPTLLTKAIAYLTSVNSA